MSCLCAAKEAPAELKPAQSKPAAKADPKDMSVADILAAARGNAPAAKEAPAESKPAESKPAATADPKDMSLADNSMNACDQFFPVEGLGHVIVRAKAESLDLAFGVI